MNINDINYTHIYWIFLLPLIMASADIATGWMQASVNGTWDSTKMRKGLYRKAGELGVIVLAYVAGMALTLPINLAGFVSGYIVIMEAISILENLDQAGVPIPHWITKKLGKVAKEMDEAEDDDEG